MLEQEKTHLIALLEDTCEDTLAALKGADPDALVYPDTGWRVRDIVGHLAAWDRAAAESVRAYAAGGGYRIPDDTLDAFNEAAFEERRAWGIEQVYADRDAAHRELVAALRTVPPEKVGGRLLLAWGGYDTLITLVKVMAIHEMEHRREVKTALQAPR